MRRAARAPGRVNLIGDHTDYTGGLVFPMAIDRTTTIVFETAASGSGVGNKNAGNNGASVSLTSDNFDGLVSFSLPITSPERVTPSWGRYVAGVAAAMAERGMTPRGFSGRV